MHCITWFVRYLLIQCMNIISKILIEIHFFKIFLNNSICNIFRFHLDKWIGLYLCPQTFYSKRNHREVTFVFPKLSSDYPPTCCSNSSTRNGNSNPNSHNSLLIFARTLCNHWLDIKILETYKFNGK